MGKVDPPGEAAADVAGWLAGARDHVAAFDPDLVVVFAPDHFNGFLYDVLPQFCVGLAAASIGDYGTTAADLPVPADLAEDCLKSVLAAGVDAAVSARMRVDHAFVQPLELLFGAPDARPVIPVFVNAAGAPLAPTGRARALGAAVGAWARSLDRRVLFVGSGGLSHDPPAPSLRGASPEVVDRLVNGLAEEDRPARERGAAEAAKSFAAGTGTLQPLAPEFDRRFMTLLQDGRFDEIGALDDDWLTRNAGRSVHEIRAWIAAFAALAAVSPGYEVVARHYRPIPEWIVGYGLMLADGGRPAPTAAVSG